MSAPRTAPPNILLITVDSLRADFVDLSGNGRTPHLARLARQGTAFTRAYTVTPWTAPALVSIFTGLYPPTHGVVNRDDTTPSALPTLPRLLQARGYTLANFGFFTEVSYYRNLGLPPQAITGAEVIGSGALAEWLPTAREPFFAWIHHVEPHLPYGAGGYEAAEVRVRGSSGLERAQLSATVPKGAGYAFAPGDREALRELYARDVAELDAAVGHELAGLAASGRAARTLVAFTADHGEELLEHGWVGHASTSGEARFAEETLHVPLILRGPGVPAGRVEEALAQNVDVAPTLLALAGLPVPREMQGIRLLRDRRPLAFFDSSPGGHLTPEARRAERLQGVGDGHLLHVERTGAASGGSAAAVGSDAGDGSELKAPALAPALARFRSEQARARLRFLARFGGASRPEPERVAAYAETLKVEAPGDGAALDWRRDGGTIRLGWRAEPGRTYWVEYEVGSGLASARGAFPVESPGVSFGPFPRAFWDDLAHYAPFRFRVLDPAGARRSAWRAFRLTAD